MDEGDRRGSVAKIVAGLAALYPRTEIGEETLIAYTRMLADLDPEALQRAATICAAESQWFPSVAELRNAAVEDTLAAAPATPAWERVVSQVYGEDVGLTDLERRALRFVGGSYAVKTSERPEWLRQQFLKAYDEMRRDEVRVRSLAGLGVTRRDALPPGPRREVEAGERALAELDEVPASWDEEIAKVADPKLRAMIEGARAASPRPRPDPDALS